MVTFSPSHPHFPPLQTLPTTSLKIHFPTSTLGIVYPTAGDNSVPVLIRGALALDGGASVVPVRRLGLTTIRPPSLLLPLCWSSARSLSASILSLCGEARK